MSKRIHLIYLFSLTGTLVWLAAIILAPYLRSQGQKIFPYLYACFSPVCHQKPERSFWLFGFPLAVCARCLGVYTGFLGGLVLYPLRRGFSSVRLPAQRLFLAVSAPIALDTAANVLRFWDTPNGVRFATGFLWGLILPFYFLTGISELAMRGRKN
jgi:uncharacterized membrane protein